MLITDQWLHGNTHSVFCHTPNIIQQGRQTYPDICKKNTKLGVFFKRTWSELALWKAMHEIATDFSDILMDVELLVSE